MSFNRNNQNLLLGFLSLYETLSHDGYIGAVLVTNLQGIPQEFRCTHPVKPTTIQKPLYGEALEPYIGVKLCGIPLLRTIQNSPSLVILPKEYLLEVRKAISYPVVYVRRTGEAIDLNVPYGHTTLKRERVDCPNGKFQPIVLTPHPNFDDDVKVAREILEDIFNYLDPLEPFERMAKAIEVLSRQDKRFQ